jgi:hypothetical protein
MPMMLQTSNRQPRKWTSTEDQKLREEVESQRECSPSARHQAFVLDDLLHYRSVIDRVTVIGGGDVKDWYAFLHNTVSPVGLTLPSKP